MGGARWYTLREDERPLVGAEEVARAVKLLMGGGGEEMRQRARELREVAMREGGSSYDDMGHLIEELLGRLIGRALLLPPPSPSWRSRQRQREGGIKGVYIMPSAAATTMARSLRSKVLPVGEAHPLEELPSTHLNGRALPSRRRSPHLVTRSVGRAMQLGEGWCGAHGRARRPTRARGRRVIAGRG
ncbi:hypothetical protein Taro_047262 [Colocasia esculenta]|uniref:Uncharacterized protein n=1 Tax=Colocasia esculenta TaxID=4460 RepID=A0A843X3L5_COLES|nr:hypothetical protein [Colocasia esculenta]